MTEDPITHGTEGEALYSLEQRLKQLKKGGGGQDRWCYKHQCSEIKYIDGVWACPDCEADAVLDINYPVTTHEADYLNLIDE